MQTIKFLPNNHIRLNNTTYKGYSISNIPNSFGFIFKNEKQGKSQWFNYKGLTYIEKTLLPW